MKRILLNIFIVTVMAGFFSSCAKNTSERELGNTSGKLTESNIIENNKDGKENTALNNEDKAEDINDDLKVEASILFIKEDGKTLWLKDLSKNKESRLFREDKLILSYDANPQYNVIAYAVNLPEDEYRTMIKIFDTNTNGETVIKDGFYPNPNLTWSPNGRYLLVTCGTDTLRGTIIYDYEKKEWIQCENTYSANWSPEGDAIALGTPEVVNPPTPVGDGYSISITVLFLGNKKEFKKIEAGTTEYQLFLLRWMDNENLIVKTEDFTPDAKGIYQRVNVKTQEIVEVEKEQVADKKLETITEELRKLGIYQIYDTPLEDKYILCRSGLNDKKIIIYDLSVNTQHIVGEGFDARWYK